MLYADVLILQHCQTWMETSFLLKIHLLEDTQACGSDHIVLGMLYVKTKYISPESLKAYKADQITS